MKKREFLGACACALLFSACGGSGDQVSPAQNGAPLAAPSGYVVPQFTVRIPARATLQSAASARTPKYVSASALSVTVTLNTVNASPPPDGLTTSVTTNVASGSCTSGCTVSGPAVPPGSDAFTITTYDANNAGGNQLASLTQSFTVTAGTSNTLSAVLDGIPATFTIAGVPSGTAGTAFGTPAPLTLTAKDADGNTIAGTYANAITLTTNDTGSLTHASALSVNGGSAASSVNVTNSSDALTLNYGGQAIASSALTASATGATDGAATFAPTLSPIVATPSEVDLYATSGAGSSGTITVSETGWSNSPYSQVFTVSAPAGCATIATVSGNVTQTTGTSFTVAAASSPTAGSCTPTFSDGAGQTQNATLTYTTTTLNVNATRRKTSAP